MGTNDPFTGNRDDRRHHRKAQTRTALLEGLRACLEEGIFQPTGQQIASRAGVSVRSVFRLSGTIQELLLDLDEAEHTRLARTFSQCPLDAPLVMRVESFLANCTHVYDGTTAVRRALAPYEHSSQPLQRRRQLQRRDGHRRIQIVFAAELGAHPFQRQAHMVRELSALVSWGVWHELRHNQGLAEPAVRAFLSKGVVDLLSRVPAGLGGGRGVRDDP